MAIAGNPRLILIGDSTVRCGRANGTDGLWGWGQVIVEHFDLDRIAIENHAMGGRSSRTFLTEGLWDKALARVRRGDYVLMQFGHNDGGEMFKGDRPRASIKGNGDETAAGVAETTGEQEIVHSYGWYLRKFIADTQQQGATPIVVSLVPRNRWRDGRVIRSSDDYARWAAEAASQSGALFLDLNELVAARYEQMGKDFVGERLFTETDWTHTSLAGAQLNAACVVEGIEQLSDCDLAAYIAADRNQPTAPIEGLRFAFGSHKVNGEVRQVVAQHTYNERRGYGFEPGQGNVYVAGASTVTSANDQPFYFSAKLPEGNYRVRLTGGDSPVTVKAELRRLMAWQNDSSQAPNTAEFTVNIRTTRIDKKRSVRLKPREVQQEMWAWDDKLTLEINGPRPWITSLEIAPEPDAITVFLAGDSTVTDQPSGPWGSWGQMLPYFFKPGVAVANYAQSGESVASSLGAGRFEKVFSTMKPGDHLFIQFGHNDMKSKQPDALSKYRKDLVGVIKRTRQLGGVPVLVTSMERKPGRKYVSLGEYPQVVRELASEYHVPLIDLNEMSRKLYAALGDDLEHAFQDGTHHTVYGSYLLAKCIIQSIVENRLSLIPHIREHFDEFDPGKPDSFENTRIPVSPGMNLTKPEGS